MTISARDSLPWDTSMPLATTASLAAVIIAANSGDNRRRRRNSSGSRDRRDRCHGYDRSHSPPTAALEFERQNVVFLLGLIREDVLEDIEPGVLLDPDIL